MSGSNPKVFGSNPKVFASTFVIMPLLYLLQMVPCVRISFGISINEDYYKLLILTLNVKLATGYRELTETTFL